MSATRSSQMCLPLPLQDILVHAHDEDLLVIGPVEDPDPPPLRQRLGVAPEEVVVEVLLRGLLEREDLAALWIYSRHDVLDRAVLAGRVHRLEDEQQRPAILGVKHILLLREPLGAALEEFGRLALVQLEAAGVAGIEVLQLEVLAFGDAERVDVFLDAVEDFLSCHGTISLSRRRSVMPAHSASKTRVNALVSRASTFCFLARG